jgi:hypothetical protein
MDDLLESGSIAVAMHVLMNDLCLIGTIARTLHVRWDLLPLSKREDLLRLIDESATGGVDRVRALMLVPAPLAGT